MALPAPYYSEDGITIYNADCREYLPAADCIITDPPYDAMTHEGAIGASIDFAPLDSPERVAKSFLSVAKKWCVVFCSLEQLGEYKIGAAECWVRAGVWDRVINMPQMSGDRPAQGAEGVAIFHRAGVKRWNGGGKAAIWRIPFEERGRKLHPTEKPLALMKELLCLFASPDDIVLDPFMGSGTTLVAAKQLGFSAIGIEKEKKYCNVAVQRLAQNRLALTGALDIL